jgi:solute carrier family 35 protein E1
LKGVTLVAFLHATGHSLTNVSFASVSVSFTHTIKTLEPVFSSIGSYLVNGQVYSLPVYLSLIPIMAGAHSLTSLLSLPTVCVWGCLCYVIGCMLHLL